jgi:hypothetical protein
MDEKVATSRLSRNISKNSPKRVGTLRAQGIKRRDFRGGENPRLLWLSPYSREIRCTSAPYLPQPFWFCERVGASENRLCSEMQLRIRAEWIDETETPGITTEKSADQTRSPQNFDPAITSLIFPRRLASIPRCPRIAAASVFSLETLCVRQPISASRWLG